MVLRISRQGWVAVFLLWVANIVNADMPLHGVAEFTELRRSFYLAGLYSEWRTDDSDALLESDQRLRMVLKVTVDRWSPRSFSSHWTRALLINHSPDTLNAFGEAVIEFSNLLQEDLVRGDMMEIERAAGGETEVRINGIPLLTVARPGFTEMLLRTWVGSRPPSTEFRQQILGVVDNPEQLAQFHMLSPDPHRMEMAEAWAGADQEQTVEEEQGDADESAHSPLAMPPQQDTVAVRAVAEVRKSEDGRPVSAVMLDHGLPPGPDAREVPMETSPSRESTQQATKVIEIARAEPAVMELPHEQAPSEQEPDLEQALSSEERQALVEIYQNMVVRKILGGVEYPEYAQRRGLEGVVQLRVQINRDGRILDIEQITGSRHAVLNDAGRKAVERAREFPRVPAAMPGEVISVEVPIRFRLQ